MARNTQQQGFTLIELMITVAIVAILAAVAYPSYQEHVRKSRRAEAQQALMNAAMRQQQFLLDTRAYAATLAALNAQPPTAVTTYYTVSMAVATTTVPAFTLTAAPVGAQGADRCATMTLSHTGAKTPAGCW